MNNEPNKPIEAEELTEKELEGIVGGARALEQAKEYTKVYTAKAQSAVRESLIATKGTNVKIPEL